MPRAAVRRGKRATAIRNRGRVIKLVVWLLLFRRLLLLLLICQTFPAPLFFQRRPLRLAGFPVRLQRFGQLADPFQFLRRRGRLRRSGWRGLDAPFGNIEDLGIFHVRRRLAVAIMYLPLGIDPFVNRAQGGR